MNWRPATADPYIEAFVAQWFGDEELHDLGLSPDATAGEINEVAALQLQAAVDFHNDLAIRDYLSTFIDYLATWVGLERLRRTTTAVLGRIARDLLEKHEAFDAAFDTDFDEIGAVSAQLQGLFFDCRSVIERLEALAILPRHAWDPDAAAAEDSDR
jgi:hypothetical protein